MNILILDIRTVIFLLCVGNLVSLATLATYQIATRQKRPYLRFLSGKLFQSLAWFLISLRGLIPDLASASIGNVLLFIGFSLELLAIISTDGLKRRWVLMYLSLSAGGAFIFWFFANTPTQRVVLATLITIALYAPAALYLFFTARGSALRYLLAIVFAIYCLMLGGRVADALMAQTEFSVLTTDLIQTLTFLSAFLLMMLTNIAFLLLLKGHDDRQLLQTNRELEQRVQERTGQLELANQEMASVSYTLAHDLRTPLLAMNGFSHILLEDYPGSLDEAARDYLNRIGRASQRMGLLTDELLNLLLISRREFKLSDIDLSLIAAQVIAQLKSEQPDRDILFICPPSLMVFADMSMARVLLEQLLSNAWKFSQNRQPAEIEIGSIPGDSEKVYFVRDNGIGLDMAYIKKLFGVFQRLNSSEQYEGTGIGLAVAKHIVHRHGGRIWAEGTLDQGTVIYFTITPQSRV